MKKKYYKLLFTELKFKQILHLSLTVIFIICTSLCTAYLPIMLKTIIDQLSTHVENIVIFKLLILYSIILILERLFSEAQFISYPNWENKILKNAYKYSFESLFNNSPAYFKKNLYGTISSQIYRAISGLDSLMFDIIFKAFPLVINFIFIIFSIIFELDITIALIITTGAIIYTGIMYLFNSKLISYQTDLRDQSNNAQGLTTDLIASWKDIKLTNSHIFSNCIINQKTNLLLNKSKIFCYKRGWFGFVQSFVVCLIVIISNYYEICRYLNAQTSLGNIVLLNNYLMLILNPLESFSFLLRSLARSYFDFMGIKELINYEKELGDFSHCGLNIHSIHFEKIEVNSILTNLSFKIRKGEKIALIGHSGAGKSTLLDILTGLRSDFKGNIYINDDHHQQVSPSILRNHIAYYSADARLIHQSISDNISLGNDVNTLRYIENVYLKEKIESLKHGIDTIISDKSHLLSNGEKQRIKIARTIALQKDFEFYDEATSALDDTLAENILSMLLSRIDKTVIFVTHNTKFLAKFDRIYSINNGQLSEIHKDCVNA